MSKHLTIDDRWEIELGIKKDCPFPKLPFRLTKALLRYQGKSEDILSPAISPPVAESLTDASIGLTVSSHISVIITSTATRNAAAPVKSATLSVQILLRNTAKS